MPDAMKRPPYIVDPLREGLTSLKPEQLQEMQQALTMSVLREAEQFRAFLSDPASVGPRYRERFERLATLYPETYERATTRLGTLSQAEWLRLRDSTHAKLTEDIKLYLDRNDMFTLQMPTRRIIDFPGKVPAKYRPLYVYDSIVELFHRSHLHPAERQFMFQRADQPEKMTKDCYQMDQWYAFGSDITLSAAINSLLPVGIRFEHGQVRRLH